MQNDDADGDPSGHSMIIGAAGGPPPDSGGAGVTRNFINLSPGYYLIQLDVMWGPEANSESWVACEINRTNFICYDLLADGAWNAFATGHASTVWETVASPPFEITNQDDYVTFWAYNRLNDWGVSIDNVSVRKYFGTYVEHWELAD
jgi:hypothetical protein